jgi:hypothetical protein
LGAHLAPGGMSMRLKIALPLAAVLMSSGASADDFRYRSSGGEFSIDMNNPDDRAFKPGPERRSGQTLLVDFWFGQGQIHGGFEQRTIEWIPLDQAPAPEQGDPTAKQLVTDYLAGRFGDGEFSVIDSRKSRDADGRLTYLFVAKGTAGDMPCGWQGSVIVFDHAIALVSEVLSLNMLGSSSRNVPEKDGVFDPSLVRWASTIRPDG